MKGCYLQEPPSVSNTKVALEVGYYILNNNNNKQKVLFYVLTHHLLPSGYDGFKVAVLLKVYALNIFIITIRPSSFCLFFVGGGVGWGVGVVGLHQEILSGVYACSSANNNGELENRHFHFQTKSRIDGRMDACKFIASSSASLRRCFPSPPH